MRAERQRAELARKRQPGERWPRRAQLWVFFVEGWLHVGWHVYVRYWSTTERRDGGGRLAYLSSRRFGYNDERVEAELFDLVPMAAGEVAGDYLIPPPVWERVNTWCEAFAKAHPKRKTKTDPRRAGLLNGWTDGRSFFLDRAAAEAGVAAREALWAGKEAA